MDRVIQFLKKAYESLYELPSYYIGLEGDIRNHIFTITFIVILFVLMLLAIKAHIDINKMKKQQESHLEVAGLFIKWLPLR